MFPLHRILSHAARGHSLAISSSFLRLHSTLPDKDILTEEIKSAGDKIRAMKALKIDKMELDSYIANLLTLKDQYKELTGVAYDTGSRSKKNRIGSETDKQPIAAYMAALREKENNMLNMPPDTDAEPSENAPMAIKELSVRDKLPGFYYFKLLIRGFRT